MIFCISFCILYLFIAFFFSDQRGSHVIQTRATMGESVFLRPMDLFADVLRDIEGRLAQVCYLLFGQSVGSWAFGIPYFMEANLFHRI